MINIMVNIWLMMVNGLLNGFPKMGVPLYRWMVYFMEHSEMDDKNRGNPHDFGNPQIGDFCTAL